MTVTLPPLKLHIPERQTKWVKSKAIVIPLPVNVKSDPLCVTVPLKVVQPVGHVSNLKPTVPANEAAGKAKIKSVNSSTTRLIIVLL